MAWTQIYDNYTTLSTSRKIGQSFVFTDPLTNPNLVIIATSATAQPTWDVAGKVVGLTTIADATFPTGQIDLSFLNATLWLKRVNLIEIPSFVTAYSLRFEILWWFREMHIQVWGEIAPFQSRFVIQAP